MTGTVKAVGSLFGAHGRARYRAPVGIVRVSAAALKMSFGWYLEIVGLVSMSLALINLLPLLPLDGGHILFSLIEAVRRRALAREVYERVSVVGFALIILIWVIALSNDFSGGRAALIPRFARFTRGRRASRACLRASLSARSAGEPAAPARARLGARRR